MSTLPIRVQVVVGRDGSRIRSLLVFCPRSSASIEPERCSRCNFRCPPEDGPRAPAVGCSVEEGGAGDDGRAASALLYGPDAAAARICAGAASMQVVICFHADAPVGVVDPVLGTARPSFAYPVVDTNRVLLGCVPGSVLATSLADPADAFVRMSELMVPAVAVRESDHLDDAIGAMTSHHLRHVPIIDDERRVTGALFDLDILHWVGRGAPGHW
jgi:CBS domain-containing protein